MVFAKEKVRISIATGGTGSVSYKNILNVTATEGVTGASVENLRFVAKKEATFGFTVNDVLYQAYKGEGKFENQRLDMLRSVV